jgi:hypothetical protein
MTRLEAFALIFAAMVTATGAVAAAWAGRQVVKQTVPNGGSSLRDTVENILLELRSVTQLQRSHADRLDDVAAEHAHTRRMSDHHANELERLGRSHAEQMAEIRRVLDEIRTP